MRYVYLSLVALVVVGSVVSAIFAFLTRSSAPQVSIDPAQQVLIKYADAIERYDQDGIFASVCEDSAPETVAQTFLAIGEDGRKATAKALRTAALQAQFSTNIKKVYSLELQTPQGQKQYPLQVILLEGKWCVDEGR
jgi:type II secretory pathway pseudopilin PulG